MAYIYSKACIDAWPGNIYYAIKHEKKSHAVIRRDGS